MRVPFLIALAACSPTTSVSLGGDKNADVDTAAPTDTGIEDIGGTDDTSESGDTGEEEKEDDTGWPKACAGLYDEDALPEFNLEFSAAEWSGMQSDCRSSTQRYRPLALTYDGETVDAMARLKGNWSWSCDKLQFIVSFNEEDPDARFHGLRKLMFDAPWYDRTLLHERLAFPLFAERGLPYSCVNNARISVNGEYYGVYANLERIDHEYLERNFEEFGGNLYQGGAELKTNEDVGDTRDLTELRNAATVDEIAALVDLDEAVAEWAMEAMIPAMDNYWAGVEINYYLYDHPSRGFLYLPYDLDISFGDASYTDGSLVWPQSLTVDPITWEHSGWRKETLLKIVLADSFWCERFVEELEQARAVYDPDTLIARLDRWDAQIADAYADDPHTPYSAREHAEGISLLREFIPARAEFVDDWLAQGGHCPAHW
jgi:spore coat protein CotH